MYAFFLYLQGKVENLEAQTSQVEILKSKVKKFLDEKRKFEETAKQAQLLLAENKANDIVLQETKNQKKQLEGKTKLLSLDIKELTLQNNSLHATLKNQDTEMAGLKSELAAIREEKEQAAEGSAENGMDSSLVLQLKSQVQEYEKKFMSMEETAGKFDEQQRLTEETTEEFTESIMITKKNDSNQAESLKRIEQQQITILELQSSLDAARSFENSVLTLQKSAGLQDEKINNLKLDFEKLEDEKNSLEQQLFDASEKYSHYESEILSLKENLNQKTALLSEREENINELKNEKKQFIEKLNSQSESYNKIQSEYDKIIKDKDLCELKIQDDCKIIDELQLKLVEFESCNVELKKSVADMSCKLQDALEKNEELNSSVNNEMQLSIVKNVNLQQMEFDVTTLKEQLHERDELVAKLEEDKLSLNQECNQIQTHIDDCMNRIREFNVIISESLFLQDIPFDKEVLVENSSILNKMDAIVSIVENNSLLFKKYSHDLLEEKGELECRIKCFEEDNGNLLSKLECLHSHCASLSSDLKTLKEDHEDLNNKHMSLISTSDEQITMLNNYESEMDSIKKALEDKNNETTSLRSQLDSNKEVIQNIEKRATLNDDKDQQISKLSDEIELLKTEVSNKEKLIEAVELTLEKERDIFKQKLEEGQTLANKLTVATKELTDKNNEINRQIDKLEQQLIMNVVQQSDKYYQLMELLSSVQHLSSNSDTEGKQVISKGDNSMAVNDDFYEQMIICLKVVEENVNKMKSSELVSNTAASQNMAKVETMLMQIKKLELDHATELNQKQQYIENLNKTLEILQKESAACNDSFNKAQENVTLLETRLNAVSDVLKDMNNDKVLLEVQLTQVTEAKNDAYEQVSVSEKEIQSVKEMLLSFQTEYDILKNKLHQVGEDDDAKITELKSSHEKMTEQLKVSRSELQELHKDFETTMCEKVRLSSQVTELSDQLSVASQEHETLLAKLLDISAQEIELNVDGAEVCAKPEKLKNQICRLNEEYGKLKYQLSEVNLTNEKLVQQIRDDCTGSEQLEIQLKKMHSQYEKLRSQSENSTGEFDRLKTEFEKLQIERNKLLKSNDELSLTTNTCLKELTNKTDDCKQLQQDKETLKQQFEETKKQFELCAVELTSLKTTTQEFEDKLKVLCSLAAPS